MKRRFNRPDFECHLTRIPGRTPIPTKLIEIDDLIPRLRSTDAS